MALRLDESGTAGAQRILGHQVADALQSLSRQHLTDVAVHEARKQLSKARATLRLVRSALDQQEYEHCNVVLRDAARTLSTSRDASVLPEALDKVLNRYGTAGRALRITALRRRLLAERARARQQLSLARARRIVTTLRALQRRIDAWRLRDSDWSVIGHGLSRIYRKGRKALATAQSRSTQDLHEWRKQVKYLRHQLRALEPVWPGVVAELADQTHKLTDYLGDDHDLAALEQRILRDDSAIPDDATRGALLALLARCRAQLQDKALILGARVYEERPRELRRRLGEYWKTWRSQAR